MSFQNLTGPVTNSDLELTGPIAHNNVLADVADITKRTALTLCISSGKAPQPSSAQQPISYGSKPYTSKCTDPETS